MGGEYRGRAQKDDSGHPGVTYFTVCRGLAIGSIFQLLPRLCFIPVTAKNIFFVDSKRFKNSALLEFLYFLSDNLKKHTFYS